MNTPQTQKEFQTNYRNLVREVNKMLLAYEKTALASGAFSLEESRGAFHLPKNVLTAALNDIECQYSPMSWHRGDHKMVKNIRRATCPDWSSI